MSPDFGPHDILGDVSRETKDRLKAFELLVRKWNPTINLVSKSTLDDFWRRHVLDSLQVLQLGGLNDDWADIGSGGGFPGLIVAIALAETRPDARVTLVESDQRKATFLRVVSSELELNTNIIADRVEKIAPLACSVLSARALAPLTTLLGYAERHLAQGGICLFPKGENFQKEVAESLVSWRYHSEIYPSQTNTSSVILKIKDITRA